MEIIDYDGGQRLWLLWKFIVNVYRKALSCIKSAKGRRWEKIEESRESGKHFSVLTPTLVYPAVSKTLF